MFSPIFQNLADRCGITHDLIDRPTLQAICHSMITTAIHEGRDRQVVLSHPIRDLLQLDTRPIAAGSSDVVWACGATGDGAMAGAYMRFVPAPARPPLAREWFMLVNSADLAVALIAAPIGEASVERATAFHVAFSFEQSAITVMCLLLNRLLSLRLTVPLVSEHQARQRHQSELIRKLLVACARPVTAAIEVLPSLNITEQIREIQQLSTLIPQFSAQTDWQQVLLAQIKQRADLLSDYH